MYGVVLVIHIVMSFILIIIILVQGGKGGMAEAFGGSGSQSLFGGGANVVMTRVTAIAAGVFLVTSLSLAKLSTARGRSVIGQMPITLPEATDLIPGVFPEAKDAASAEPEPETFPTDTTPAPAPAPVIPESLPSEDEFPLE